MDLGTGVGDVGGELVQGLMYCYEHFAHCSRLS
jgi:hypothetical protein